MKFSIRAQAVPASFILVVLLLLFVFYVAPQFQKPEVYYQISLEKDKIVKGESQITLFYKINNNLGRELNGVELNYEILGTQIKKTLKIEHIKPEDVYLGNTAIDLRTLNKGSYVIRTTLIYSSNNQQKALPLQLGIEIF